MGKVTIARLVARRDLGQDQWEYRIRLYDASGAEVEVGLGGNDSPINSTDDIAEGETNLYYTDARVDEEIANELPNTDSLDEGGQNLYYTDDRADARVTAGISAARGANNGIAGLDSSGLVSASQLPSYVDDVLEYNNQAAFPGTGETGKIYVAKDTNKTYRWSGSVYVEISASPGSSDSVVEGSTNLYYTAARSAAVTAALALKRAISGQAKVTLSDPTNDFIEKYEVINDGSSTSGWSNRAEYGVTPVGGGSGAASRIVWYLNEYFEHRLNARQNTVAWRAFVREFPADPAHDMSTPIWEIQDDRTNRTQKHGMFGQGNFYHAGDGTVAGSLAVSGTVTASNIGVPIKGVYNTGSEPTGQPTGTIILVRP